MPRSKVRDKGQVTIPNEIREQANIEEGTYLEFDLTAEGILVRPQLIVDAKDAWFWSAAWQEGEREVEEELAAGQGEVYTDDEFMKALEKR